MLFLVEERRVILPFILVLLGTPWREIGVEKPLFTQLLTSLLLLRLFLFAHLPITTRVVVVEQLYFPELLIGLLALDVEVVVDVATP